MVGRDVLSNTKKTLRKTNVHVAGVSCKPFSPMGSNSGTHSVEMSATASWAALCLKLGHDVIIVEDVACPPGSLWQEHPPPPSPPPPPPPCHHALSSPSSPSCPHPFGSFR